MLRPGAKWYPCPATASKTRRAPRPSYSVPQTFGRLGNKVEPDLGFRDWSLSAADFRPAV